MNSYNLKAKTLTGDSYCFSIQDGPVLLDDNTLILSNRQNSPKLLYNTIRAGCDVKDIFDGTILRDSDNNIFTISHKRGFACRNANGTIQKLISIEQPVIEGEIDIQSIPSYCRLRLVYKSASILFTIADIVGAYNDDIILSNTTTKVPIKSVQQYTGMYLGTKQLYFGDKVHDSSVIMYYGRIGVLLPQGFLDLADKTMIKVS